MIPPFKTDDGREMFVLYVHPYQGGILETIDRFAGRNWRRVKRELRKFDLKYNSNKGTPHGTTIERTTG